MFTAPLGLQPLTQILGSGSPLLITDSNVLRYSSATATATFSSSGLQAGATGAGVWALFPQAGAQTVSYIPGVARVTSSVSSVGQPSARAENVLDGDPRTTWQTGSLANAAGQWIEVDFDRPYAVRTIRITVPDLSTGSRLLVARVETSDGAEKDVVMIGRNGSVELDGRPVSALRIKMAKVEGGGPLAIADIAIDDLDFREYRQVPSDVVDRAKTDTTLAAAMQSTTLGFVFRREVGVGPRPVEQVLRRRFELLSPSQLTMRARVSFTDERSAAFVVGKCGDLSLEIDGVGRPMEVLKIDDDGVHAVAGSCDDIVLEGGWHSMNHSVDLQVDWLTLLPPNVSAGDLFEPYTPLRPSVEPERMFGARIGIPKATSATNFFLISGRASHPGWEAELGGMPLATLDLDGQATFEVPAGVTVRIRFAPQSGYDLLFVLMIVSIVTALVLITRSRSTRSL